MKKNLHVAWLLKNKHKHKVSFEEAKTAFLDPIALLLPDFEHSDDEERFVLLCESTSERLLMVCHCIRGNDDIIRIISARKATSQEKRQYYNQ